MLLGGVADTSYRTPARDPPRTLTGCRVTVLRKGEFSMALNGRGGRRNKWYLTVALFLLVVASWIADRVGVPTWVDVVFVAVVVAFAPWVIWTLLRDWRGEGPN